MRNYPSIQVTTTSTSVVVLHNGEYVAEYASKDPSNDARRMRTAIVLHLDDGGTISNYQW